MIAREKRERGRERERKRFRNTSNPDIEDEELLVVARSDLFDKVRFTQ